MKKNILHFFCVVLLCFIASPRGYCESIQEYNYYSYDDSGFLNRISININKSAVYIGHAGRKASICKPGSDQYCISSSVINFYVPKSGIAVGMKWMGGGAYFNVIREDNFYLLGVKVRCFVINREGGDVYLYSEVNGLIGFSLGSKGSSALYLSSSAHGFREKRGEKRGQVHIRPFE